MKSSSQRLGSLVGLLIALQVSFLASSALAVQYSELAGTQWPLQATASIRSSVPGASGSTKGGGTLAFDADGTLYLEDSEGYTITGSWTVDSGGNLQTVFTADDVINFVYDNLPGAYVNYIDRIEVHQVSSKPKLTVKKGVGKLSLSLSFQMTITIQGETPTMTYKLKAKGSRGL